MSTVQTVAEFIPAKARATIYTVLGTAILVEQVWNVFPDALEGKVLATLSILGFGLAAANAATPNTPPPPEPPPEFMDDAFDIPPAA